jgi:xanthine dehydrogenase accessory factor
MARFEIFELIAAQRATGQPFAVVTVVRTADVTSAKAGAKALVTASGEILGHVGGGCVQGAVRSAAAQALKSGAVATIRVKPAGEVVTAFDTDGTPLHKSGCPSGGTIELLIEPYAPPPAVVVAGASPVAVAIGRIAHITGYRVIHAALAEDHGLVPMRCARHSCRPPPMWPWSPAAGRPEPCSTGSVPRGSTKPGLPG